MKNIFHKLKIIEDQLRSIEPLKIQEAHQFLIDTYRSNINLTTDDKIKLFLSGKGDKWLNKNSEIQQFFNSKPTSATDFRSKSRNIKLDDTRDPKHKKNVEWFIQKIAYYWTLLESFNSSDLEVILNPQSKIFPIIIKSEKFGLSYPPDFHKNTTTYIGFYPRSGLNRIMDIGVMSLTMSSNGISKDEKFRKGEFEITVFYSDHNIVFRGEWIEEISEATCFLRTISPLESDEYLPSIISSSLSFSKDDKRSNLVLSQINIQDRNNDKNKYLLATLNTTNRDEGFSFSSMAVFLKKESIERACAINIDDSFLKEYILRQPSDVLPEVRYFLYGQKLSLNFPLEGRDKGIPYLNEVQEIKKIMGSYQGYFLKERGGEITLDRFGIEILADGRVRDLDSNKKYYDGFVNYVNTESSIPIWILNLHLSEQEDFYQVRFNLESGKDISNDNNTEEQIFFRGVYTKGGYEHPSAGKVFLEKQAASTNISFDEIMFTTSDINNQYKSWSSNEALITFFSNSFLQQGKNFLPGLRQYIPIKKGKLPSYFNNKSLAIFTVFIDETSTDEQKENFMFRQLKFKRMPISFMPGNTFSLNIDNERHVWGNYTIEYDQLVLTVQDSPFFERFYFSLFDAKEHSTKFQYSFGVMSGFNRILNPQSHAAMLMDISQEEAFFQIFENPQNEKVDSNTSLSTRNAVTFLYSGRYNRVIHLPRKKNSAVQVNFDSTRRSFFYSAVYIWQNQTKNILWDKEYKNGKEIKDLCIQYMNNALIHGFAVSKYLDFKRIRMNERSVYSKYPQELSMDFEMLIDFLHTIEDKDFKEKTMQMFDIDTLCEKCGLN